MSTEREEEPTSPPSPREETNVESLTDLIDRMDRERFRRSLEHRELRVVSAAVGRRVQGEGT